MNKYWIKSPVDTNMGAVSFQKELHICKPLRSATLKVSAMGLYEATLDGEKIGDRVFTPGFTSYQNRIQYQEYELAEHLHDGALLSIAVADGWAVGHIGSSGNRCIYSNHPSVYADVYLVYADGSEEHIYTDTSWRVFSHEVLFSSIYHGETVDKTHLPQLLGNAEYNECSYTLTEDIGEPIREQEMFFPTLLVTPKGERVLDFHQNLTGYVSLEIQGERGTRVALTFAEVLDKDGNFYNENYRAAKNEITYILSGGKDYFKPRFSFQGFRYVRIDAYPLADIDVNGFHAIAVHSDMRRMGYFSCGNEKINQLYHNIIWGQKSNYLDIPTDCPQRDERHGWTGDAQVFCRTAALNYDVRAFFKKWLTDLRFEQNEDGAIYGTCPESEGIQHCRTHSRVSAGWGDAATIIPWTLYEIYGDKKILADNYDMMKRWVDYMRAFGDEEYLWIGGTHYGDWLAIDAGEDAYEGLTSMDFIASAFYAYSTKLLLRAGEVLGKDTTEEKRLYENVLRAFRARFMKDGMPVEDIVEGPLNTHRSGMTQTGITLILQFGLYKEEERIPLVERLEALIHEFGGCMSTGFLGTPYILHVLSDNGKAELAYQLLFNEGVPSWLYSVNHGATTMWEHWNGIKEDGSFWSADMNSFNHYAYGAVGDWLYKVVAGICVEEPGYATVTLKPIPDKRLGYVNCSVDTPNGCLKSQWCYKENEICFEFHVPNETVAIIILPNGESYKVCYGTHKFSIKE